MRTQLSINFPVSSNYMVDCNEAPDGFVAVSKNDANTSNACNSCDARQLCIENKDDWCLHNRCMSYEVIAFKDGNLYGRKDKQSVIFKKK